MKRKSLLRIGIMLLVLIMTVCFVGCGAKNNTVKQLTLILTEDEFAQLEEYPNLKELDLRGSDCYDAIIDYIEAHPKVEVLYSVDLGGIEIDSNVTEAVLEQGKYDYDIMMTNLAYLPNLTKIQLPKTELKAKQIAAIGEKYSNITAFYTVELLGRVYAQDACEIDLSSMTSEQMNDIIIRLENLPNASYIELMDSDGKSGLNVSDVKALTGALCDATVHYTFELFGKTLSTTDERVEFVNEKIGNKGEAEIRAALDIMKKCTYFKLDNCGISNEVLTKLYDDYYPRTKIVWRLYMGRFDFLTDSDTIVVTFALDDKNSYLLGYCTDTKYLDVGHNETLSDISFIANMPKLEICILSGSYVCDIGVFKNHKNIEFLELIYCWRLKDISPLENCTNLKYLNLSFTAVSELSPLDNLPLERFNCLQTDVPNQEEKDFIAKHPDCFTRFEGKQPYGYGWRYEDQGRTYWWYYAKMREIFDYDSML